jgi:cell division topological specificity factor
MHFLDRLFGHHEPTSRQVAKDRLQLVLVHDRINISPAMLDTMKDEMIKVISKYVEIDPDGVEVTFSQSKRQSRLTADIPVVGPVRHQTKKGSGKAKTVHSQAEAGGDG